VGVWLNTEGWERENEQHEKFGVRDMTSETAYLIRVGSSQSIKETVFAVLGFFWNVVSSLGLCRSGVEPNSVFGWKKEAHHVMLASAIESPPVEPSRVFIATPLPSTTPPEKLLRNKESPVSHCDRNLSAK
jgi:hypothetical protein